MECHFLREQKELPEGHHPLPGKASSSKLKQLSGVRVKESDLKPKLKSIMKFTANQKVWNVLLLGKFSTLLQEIDLVESYYCAHYFYFRVNPKIQVPNSVESRSSKCYVPDLNLPPGIQPVKKALQILYDTVPCYFSPEWFYFYRLHCLSLSFCHSN